MIIHLMLLACMGVILLRLWMRSKLPVLCNREFKKMSMPSNNSISQFAKVKNYLDICKKNPKKDVKFFMFDEEESFIVEGVKLRLLPFKYHHLYEKDEFYVHISLKEKEIIYYAFDVGDFIKENRIKEESGFMIWSDLEDCIFNFFVLNIKEMTSSSTPYADVLEPNNIKRIADYKDPRALSAHKPFATMPSSHRSGAHSHSSYVSETGYGTQAYKDREAFFDKLWPMIKESKTSRAIDFIDEHIGKMCEEKKFEELNMLIDRITFDKLNIPTMLTILSKTNETKDVLKARKEFYGKVKNHITKLKPSRASMILKEIEVVA